MISVRIDTPVCIDLVRDYRIFEISKMPVGCLVHRGYYKYGFLHFILQVCFFC